MYIYNCIYIIIYIYTYIYIHIYIHIYRSHENVTCRPSNCLPGLEQMWLAAEDTDGCQLSPYLDAEDRLANGGASPWMCAASNDCKGEAKLMVV